MCEYMCPGWGPAAEFLPRLQNSRNRQWLATTAGHGGQAVGSIAIDGEDLGSGQAHLRGFMQEEAASQEVVQVFTAARREG